MHELHFLKTFTMHDHWSCLHVLNNCPASSDPKRHQGLSQASQSTVLAGIANDEAMGKELLPLTKDGTGLPLRANPI